MPASDTPAPPQPRTNRRAAAWISSVALALLLLLTLRWVSQPSVVGRLILAQVGKALALEITVSGASEYRLRGTPLLEVRDVVARQKGASAPLLRAGRIRVELPWSTLRARGADLTVQRIELDDPQLDLHALQHWLASRPPSETRIPTLTDGLYVKNGRVVGESWSVDGLRLDLPFLHPQRAVSARLRGRATSGTTHVPFDLRAALTRPAAGAGLGLSGDISIDSRPWTLPVQATLSGRTYSDDDGIGLDRLRLAAQARYRNGDTNLPFVLGLAGRARLRDGELGIAPLGVAVRGRPESTELVPTLDGHGRFAFGEMLAVQLEGRIANWPQSWPALPPPIGQSPSPLPFLLAYNGRTDLSETTALQLRRDGTTFDGRFRLPQMLDWIDAGAQGSALPPLAGRLTTPKAEIAGAVLEGVDIEFGDDAPTAP